jgi:3-deoxy-D-arabino-heptulosonate 7-phosphate (DAHP) synthase class II
MLWPSTVTPIDLLEVADQIDDAPRMELIKALVCGSGAYFDVHKLHAWLTKFIKENEMPPKAGSLCRPQPSSKRK